LQLKETNAICIIRKIPAAFLIISILLFSLNRCRYYEKSKSIGKDPYVFSVSASFERSSTSLDLTNQANSYHLCPLYFMLFAPKDNYLAQLILPSCNSS
jgi:hypothetical protein